MPEKTGRNMNANPLSSNDPRPYSYQSCTLGFGQHLTRHSPENSVSITAILRLDHVRIMRPRISISHVKNSKHSHSQK